MSTERVRLLLPTRFDRFEELLAEAVYFELPELADAVRKRQRRSLRQRAPNAYTGPASIEPDRLQSEFSPNNNSE